VPPCARHLDVYVNYWLREELESFDDHRLNVMTPS